MIVCKHCGRPWDDHSGKGERCLKHEKGTVTGELDTFYSPLAPESMITVENLVQLVKHMWIHAGYRDNGIEKMSEEERALYQYCKDYGDD